MIGTYRQRVSTVHAMRWMATHESTRELMSWVKDNGGDARWYPERVEVKENGRIVSEHEPERIFLYLGYAGSVEMMPLDYMVMHDIGDFEVIIGEDFRDRYESAT